MSTAQISSGSGSPATAAFSPGPTSMHDMRSATGDIERQQGFAEVLQGLHHAAADPAVPPGGAQRAQTPAIASERALASTSEAGTVASGLDASGDTTTVKHQGSPDTSASRPAAPVARDPAFAAMSIRHATIVAADGLTSEAVPVMDRPLSMDAGKPTASVPQAASLKSASGTIPAVSIPGQTRHSGVSDSPLPTAADRAENRDPRDRLIAVPLQSDAAGKAAVAGVTRKFEKTKPTADRRDGVERPTESTSTGAPVPAADHTVPEAILNTIAMSQPADQMLASQQASLPVENTAPATKVPGLPFRPGIAGPRSSLPETEASKGEGADVAGATSPLAGSENSNVDGVAARPSAHSDHGLSKMDPRQTATNGQAGTGDLSAAWLGGQGSAAHSQQVAGVSFSPALTTVSQGGIVPGAVPVSSSGRVSPAVEVVSAVPSSTPVKKLEVSVQDPLLGTVGVQAEMRSGVLHASVSGSQDAVGATLSSLHHFLQDHQIAVNTLSFTGSPGRVSGPPTAMEAGDGTQHFGSGGSNSYSSPDRQQGDSQQGAGSADSNRSPLPAVNTATLRAAAARGHTAYTPAGSTLSIHI